MGLFSSSRRNTTNTTNTAFNTQLGLENIEGPALIGDGNVLAVDESETYNEQNFSYDYESNSSVDIAVDRSTALDLYSNLEAGQAAVLGDGNTLLLNITDAGAISAGLEAFRDTIGFAESVAERQRDSFAEVLGVNRSVIESGLDFGRNAFAFGRDAIDLGGEVLEANAGVTQYGLDFAQSVSENGLARVSEFGRFGLDAVAEANDRALDFGADLFQRSLAGLLDVVDTSQQTIAQTVGGLNTIARQQSTSDNERVQKIAMVALGVAAVVVVLPLIFKR